MPRSVKGGTPGSTARRDGAADDERRSDARRERWRAHREHRRAQFVEATIRAIARHGAGVGMDEIAAEAGVSKPVLYRHFTDKADLYLAVSRRATEMLMQRLAPALQGGGSPLGWIRTAVDTYLATIEEYPELYRFMVRRSFADQPVEHDPVAEDKAMIATVLARILGELLRAFRLDSGAAEPWSYALVGMVQTAGDWWLERQTMSRESLTEYLTELIWHALDGTLRAHGVEVDPHADTDAALDALRPRLRVLEGGVATGEDPEPTDTRPDEATHTPHTGGAR
ncbi:MAG TPA: TetR/AcrR family transcriptional regulator [Pseudonocardiaceae bacterium]